MVFDAFLDEMGVKGIVEVFFVMVWIVGINRGVESSLNWLFIGFFDVF